MGSGARWLLAVSLGALLLATAAGAAAPTITEFRAGISAESVPMGIAAGPDGNLWFTENAANKIGRITVGGAITELACLPANSGPTNITTGPDGRLWLTETGAGRIASVQLP